MKLSQLSNEQISALPLEQIEQIVYGDLCDRGDHADVALVLGTSPEYHCRERALCAARIYQAGRVKYIIPSGGVVHTFPKGPCTEAEHMQTVLLEAGVPAEAIILENEARTTKENMVCGTFQIVRKLLIQNVKRVMIISAATHIQRSLVLAKLFLPRSIQITASFFPELPDGKQWWEDDLVRRDAIREVQLMRDLIRQGLMDEIELQ